MKIKPKQKITIEYSDNEKLILICASQGWIAVLVKNDKSSRLTNLKFSFYNKSKNKEHEDYV